MNLDLMQVKLRLTSDKTILNQLKQNKILHKDEQGLFYSLQFDSQEFKFRPGIEIPVAKTIADRLVVDSYIIIGDHLTGAQVPVLERAGSFKLGEETPEQKAKITACPICNKDQQTLPRLARHLMKAHTKDRPEYYVEAPKAKPESLEFDEPEEVEADATA